MINGFLLSLTMCRVINMKGFFYVGYSRKHLLLYIVIHVYYNNNIIVCIQLVQVFTHTHPVLFVFILRCIPHYVSKEVPLPAK